MSEPLISAVLALDAFPTGARTIAALRGQTVAARLELVLAGPGIEIPAGATDGIGRVVAVDVAIEPLSAARAEGVAVARGRAVYVAETHGFPRSDCLEQLVCALERGAVAAMPRIVNANPGTYARGPASSPRTGATRAPFLAGWGPSRCTTERSTAPCSPPSRNGPTTSSTASA